MTPTPTLNSSGSAVQNSLKNLSGVRESRCTLSDIISSYFVHMQMKGLHSVCALAPYVQAGAGTKLHKENRKSTFKKLKKKKRRKNMQCYSVSKTLFRVFFLREGGILCFIFFFFNKCKRKMSKCQNVKLKR